MFASSRSSSSRTTERAWIEREREVTNDICVLPSVYMKCALASISQEGRIISLQSSAAQLGGLANGGVYLVHPRTLSGGRYNSKDKVSLENDIFPVALASGQRLFGVEFSSVFIDIGVPSDYCRAESLLAP